jgi:hypothetical protein
MDSDALKRLKAEFDRALAEWSDEELHAFFDNAAEERMSRVTEPYGYRFLNEKEEVCVGDLYYENGDWILHEGPIFIWDRAHGYMMARLKV